MADPRDTMAMATDEAANVADATQVSGGGQGNGGGGGGSGGGGGVICLDDSDDDFEEFDRAGTP